MSTEINDMNAEIRKFIDNMTEEQKALARKCKTPEEFMKLAQDEMIELSDEQLAMVAGGWSESPCNYYDEIDIYH